MERYESQLPAVPEIIRATPLVLDAEHVAASSVVPLSHYLWILRRHGWKMLGFVVFAVLATLIVSLRLTPIYESTVTIDIDRRMPTGVLGQEAAQVGSAYAFDKTDWLFPSFREMAVFMTIGYPMNMIFQYWSGDERGLKIPEGLNIFPVLTRTLGVRLGIVRESFSQVDPILFP